MLSFKLLCEEYLYKFNDRKIRAGLKSAGLKEITHHLADSYQHGQLQNSGKKKRQT